MDKDDGFVRLPDGSFRAFEVSTCDQCKGDCEVNAVRLFGHLGQVKKIHPIEYRQLLPELMLKEDGSAVCEYCYTE